MDRKLALVCVAVLALLLGWREIFGPDIGFHLECGRRVAERGPRLQDDLTWTAGDRRYIDLQWSWQMAMVGAGRALGTAGIVGLNLALTLGAMALLALRSFRREGAWSPWLPAWLLLFAGANLWEVRPHAASWLLLSAVLWCLEERARGARRALLALPPLMLLWVNVHSLYVLGLAAIAIHGAADLLRDRKEARPLAAAGALSLLACFVNPFGHHALLYPVRQLWEIGGASLFNRPDVGVTEFQSPWTLFEYTVSGSLVLVQPILFLHLAMLLSALALLVGWRRQRLADGLLLAAFGFLLWQAQKNFGYFAVAGGPAIVAGLGALTRRRWSRVAVPVGVIVLCAVLALQLQSGWLYAQQRIPHRVGHAWNARMLPVRACAFLNARVPPGRLLNHWNHGGYVSFATRRPVFIDARTDVMGERFFAAYLRLNDPSTLEGELSRWDPQIVLVPLAEAPVWVEYFTSSPRWRLVYADEQDFVFLRAGFAPEVGELRTAALPPPDPARVDRALDRALSLGSPSFPETLRGDHHDPLVELRWAASWLYRGQAGAALRAGVEGMERATLPPTPGLFHNTMLALLRLGDLPRALRCYRALPPERQDPALGEGLRRAVAARGGDR